MRKIVSLLLLAIPFAGISQQQKYHIRGLLRGLPPKAKVYLVYKKGNNFATDSCTVKRGVFAFSGVCNEPQAATLLLGRHGQFQDSGQTDTQPVYLETGTVHLEGKDTLANARVWGTPLNADNQEKLKLIRTAKNVTKEGEAKLMAAFTAKHSASRVSLDWMADLGPRNKMVVSSYPGLSRALRETRTGKELGQAIKTFLSVKDGQIAPDFELPDQEGRMIKLSDFRGKYVLLDFWSSWCKPCRALQPHLKEIYDALFPTGKFVILAVSLDKNKAAWLKAIKEDNVPWLQVADLGAARNKAAALYDITLIPASFVIGPDGILLNAAQRTKIMRDKMLPSAEPDLKSTGRLSDLNQQVMLAALEKENLNKEGFMAQYRQLDSILETDIGESALSTAIGKLDYKKDSTALRQLLATKGSSLFAQKLKMKQAFIAANPDSFISLYQLSTLELMYSADSYAQAYEGLSERLKNTTIGRQIKERIDRMKITPTGMKATDFSRKDQYGKTIKLSDYKGKLVLLDFWGSWCVPCRQTHPHLKTLYEKYKSKGLEIVAVANEKNKDLQKAKQAWLDAINKDDANWVHVLNDEGTGDTDIVKAYGITTFPTKLLLDKNGKILMRVTAGLNDEMDVLIRKLLDHEAF
ncbi:thiol-disulfide isomerase/thioredoxin [Pedobacter africanus]|uniref:Thiol-disulfide isomerase/thioredoxin n=1 Tax=Pedobacter africanus TaxID=151894 RepID=A0ACC6L1R9_9SPHI|nr:TlpA disulfide reductase family protein [Pedobacter africanus]MDR6785387.1 thiol-disulfide isomerase/thioredoxin [Pedobacter africanus]